MARPASYMSENDDFRPRWASVKPLGENIDPIREYGYLIMFLREY